MAGLIITVILWGVLSLIMYIPHIPFTKDLDESDKSLVIFIFLLGGPFFAIANILEQLLDNILPPGWGGDDDDDFISRF